MEALAVYKTLPAMAQKEVDDFIYFIAQRQHLTERGSSSLLEKQLAALDDVCGMLTKSEADALDESLERGIRFKQVNV